MDKIQFINEQMDLIAVPYEWEVWSSRIQYPYFTGEFTEEPPITEDGAEQSTLILNGFHRGSRTALEAVKDKIKKHFDPIHGLRGRTDSGSIAVFFDGSFSVPTGEAELKRIQINLTIKEWKGDL